MQDFLFQWMKNLAIYYLILSTLLHLVPDEKYTRYIRYFMGLFLVSMLCTPILAIAGKEKLLTDNLFWYMNEAENKENDLWKKLQLKEKIILEGLEKVYEFDGEQNQYSVEEDWDETMERSSDSRYTP